jgi:hypothetical protein
LEIVSLVLVKKDARAEPVKNRLLIAVTVLFGLDANSYMLVLGSRKAGKAALC